MTFVSYIILLSLAITSQRERDKITILVGLKHLVLLLDVPLSKRLFMYVERVFQSTRASHLFSSQIGLNFSSLNELNR